jgi:transcriptional regulator with XRE-family HTH domain
MSNPIYQHREALGLTRGELAALLGCSPQAVGVWERGEGAPSTGRVEQLAGLFGIPAGALLESLVAYRLRIRKEIKGRLGDHAQ